MTEIQTNIIAENTTKIENFMTIQKNIRSTYAKLMSDYFEQYAKENLTGEWKFGWLHNNSVIFLLKNGIRNGEVDYTRCEIFFGRNRYGIEDNEFEFTINPFTAGSFDPTTDNYLRHYFTFHGALCTDLNGFTTMIKKYVTDFYNEWYVYEKQINDLDYEITKINREEQLRIKAERAEEVYNNLKSANSELCVVIDKGDPCITEPDARITYRKKPVKVMCEPMSYNNAAVYMRSLYKSEYHKYQVIELGRLKFN